MKRLWKLLLLAVLPVAVLLGIAEVAVRLAGLAVPKYRTLPFPDEFAGLCVHDSDLFWSYQPGFRGEHEGARISINSLGLRSPEVLPKQPGEFRILSLGESTTFGAKVHDEQTYSRELERILNERMSRPCTVINAGGCAYSSFQSLKYLELRGLELQPDLVLFYHELNDYLPCTARDSSVAEDGAMKTDVQLYESRMNRFQRVLMDRWALYRFLNYHFAARRVRNLRLVQAPAAWVQIGLPGGDMSPFLIEKQKEVDADTAAVKNEFALGRRLSEREREETLANLARLCREKDIGLVIMHPAYAESIRHECLLTRFCTGNTAPMLEAYDVLHPPGAEQTALFLDPWHPSPQGHRNLAQAIADFLVKQGLIGE